ncbi:DUF4426 domain-containing protein [Luteimonas sp. e5]
MQRSRLTCLASLGLIALLAACQRTPAPQPAAAVTANAPGQAAEASLGGIRLQARLVRSSDLGAAMATRYRIERDDASWLLLLSPRDAQGDAVDTAGLQLEARAGGLAETPQPIELRAVEVEGFTDLIGVVRARAPQTLRVEIDARHGTARAEMRFSRELPKR